MARRKTPLPASSPKSAPKKPKGFALPATRGTDAWREWVLKFADHQRAAVPALIDQALVHYAKAKGFKDKPPRR
jgi:hypothetical protein